MTTRTSKGFLLVTMQCPPAMEEEFNAWYDTEHIPERLAVPGVLTGLRFVALTGHPRYLAMYDLERPDVMESPAYLKVAHGNSSPWTKRVTSRVKVYRSAGVQVWPGDRITGRCSRLTLLRFRGLGGEAARELVSALEATFASRPETLGARLLKHDAGGGAFDWLGLVEQKGGGTSAPDLAPLGKLADALDLVNVYAPY